MKDSVCRLSALRSGMRLTSKAADLFRSSCSIFLAALATSSSASFCSTVYKCWFLRKIYNDTDAGWVETNRFGSRNELLEDSVK